MNKPMCIVANNYRDGTSVVYPVFQPGETEALEEENKQLKIQLEVEHRLRMIAEQRVQELESLLSTKRKRRTKSEIDANTKLEYSPFKSDGKPKAQAAEAIRSYDDFVAIQQCLLKNSVRDWMLWTIGVSFGFRISDLLKLKIKDLLNDDLTFRRRIKIVEKKTSKLNNCLITDSVIDAVTKYFDSIKWQFSLDDYLFVSQKTKDKLKERHGWRIISNAGKSLKIPLNVGSHTMRKSFANIAACVDKTSIDMNMITKVQGLLNHSDQRVTMKYLGTLQTMYDKARMAVSDFILGKTTVNDLIIGNVDKLDEITSKLDALETKFFDKANHKEEEKE